MSQDLVAGTKLGRYSIVAPLGSGGMGVVYQARDERLERTVALKMLLPGILPGSDARLRFHREARALAKLSHPNIAAIYDVGEQDGVDYIVMEYIAGESLATRLKSGPLSLQETAAITLQIAQALEQAHEHGVIHRDLKPQNIMLTTRNEVKVLDFGIAKLLAPQPSDLTVSIATQGIVGTPLYMSPEQVTEGNIDHRTDLWSLGVIYFEALSGRTPFQADTNFGLLRSIAEEPAPDISGFCPSLPPLALKIAHHALEKQPDSRYRSAFDLAHDARALLLQLSTPTTSLRKPASRSFRFAIIVSLLILIPAFVASLWLYHLSSRRLWAREIAIPQVTQLLADKKPLSAFLLLTQAEEYIPSDPQVQQIVDRETLIADITSSPSGAQVEIEDYNSSQPWHTLGITPLNKIRIPRGYFRWRVSKPGLGEDITAPFTDRSMHFALDDSRKAPQGMVPVPAGTLENYIGFIGWIGPYELPPYYVDRFEVTNSAYQAFVDAGGYKMQTYWHEPFQQGQHALPWGDAMQQFRDSTGRPGPATWAGGHYPEGAADLPVSGISWYEASAYAVFAGKQLPTLAQWFEIAPPEAAPSVVPVSNLSGVALAPVGSFKGLGPFGTYDMAGNVREWIANPVDPDLRFILGGSWKSPSYLYSSPEAASPFDRSDGNGFRCVRNLTPLPANVTQPIHRTERSFAHFKPAPDAVFQAYKLLYSYPPTPLNAKVEGIVKETVDWREEKISYDTGYRGERMSAYLFLPKTVRPPFQTVLFFPSARVLFLPPDSAGGLELGDVKFFDYILQSGRAVMYPIYEGTYERRVNFNLPSASENIDLTTDRYKDAARTLDYMATRPDLDSTRVAYLGVSMGAAQGVIITALLQDRLKAAIFLDGGFFLDPPPPGADQADFAPRIKKPVLMVNGRYDFTFAVEEAQNPLFNMLGTPDADKRHIILNTPHDVTEDRPALAKAVLDWLNQYLGPVND